MTRRFIASGLATVAVLVLVACGGGAKHASKPAGADFATVRTAKCNDWLHASPDEKSALTQGMRDFFSGEVDQPGSRGQVLDNRAAATLFDNYCKQGFATDFYLYRVYGNAAAFTVPK